MERESMVKPEIVVHLLNSKKVPLCRHEAEKNYKGEYVEVGLPHRRFSIPLSETREICTSCLAKLRRAFSPLSPKLPYPHRPLHASNVKCNFCNLGQGHKGPCKQYVPCPCICHSDIFGCSAKHDDHSECCEWSSL